MSNENYMAIDLGSQAFKYVVFNESGNQIDSGKISSGSAYKNGQFNFDYMRANFQSLKNRINNNEISLASDRLKIVATAGFRNAKNSDEVLKIAKQDFGLNIEVIDGKKEAYYSMFGAINDFNSKESDKKHIKNFIHIDIGGRSTEVSSLFNGKFKTISLDFGISVYNQRIINAIKTGNYKNIDLEKDKILNEIRESLKEFNIDTNVEDTALLMNNQSYRHICSKFEKDDNTNNLFALSKVMPELSRIAKLDKKKILAENYLDIEAIDEKGEKTQSREYNNFLAGAFLTNSFFKALGLPENLQTFPTYSGVPRGLVIDMLIEDSKKTKEEKSSTKEEVRGVVVNEKLFIGNDVFEEEPQIKDISYKQTIKEFYEQVASRDEATLDEEENQSINTYSATITYKTGEKLDILSKNPNHISLSSFNKEGKPQIPELKHFTDIVKYAQNNSMDIVFADIKDNEYSARLYLACLQNGEVKVDNPPKLDEAFWKTVDADTKQKIQKILEKEKVIEPVIVAEPVIEPVIVAEPVIEPVIVAEPVIEPVIVAEPVIEPVIVAEPVIEPVIVAEPVIEPVIVAEPVIEPVVITESIADLSNIEKVRERSRISAMKRAEAEARREQKEEREIRNPKSKQKNNKIINDLQDLSPEMLRALRDQFNGVK